MFLIKVAEKVKTHILWSITFVEDRATYEIMAIKPNATDNYHTVQEVQVLNLDPRLSAFAEVLRGFP
jgi:hypothetical protein